MNLLITGSGGMLGSAIVKLAKSKGCKVRALTRDELKFGSLQNLKKLIREFSPDVVMHCAANTNVELCEKDPDTCYKDNTALTDLLVNATRTLDCSFVFISITGVYGENKSSPYVEYDEPIPTTHHHRSKLLAENIVLSLHPKPLIIRTGWLFGGEVNNPKNFVVNRLKELVQSTGEMFSDNTQIGNPTWVNDVNRQIFVLLKHGWTGVFNCVNQGVASRFEYVSAIVKLSGQNIQVVPVDASQFKRVAKVSKNESALNNKLNIYELDIMPHWEDSLAGYLDSIESSVKDILSN